MSVVAADRAAVRVAESRRDAALLGVRCCLLGAIALGATVFAAPRVALVRHGEGVVLLGVLMAVSLAVRSWRGISLEPRAIPVRSADLSIAGGLACAAAFLAWQMPVVFGADADAWGASLAIVAPLVGAAIAVLFGSRMLYRMRGAVTALALLSPALLRPAYVVLDAATRLASRTLVSVAATIDHSLLGSTGSTAAAGDLLALRLTNAGALVAAAVMILFGWRTAQGTRSARTTWSAFVAVVCVGGALCHALPVACAAAVLAMPVFRLRLTARERQDEPLRCFPRGEPTLLAATAVALVGIGIITAQVPLTTSTVSVTAFPDAVAALPGATITPADAREVALAGAGAHWQHWSLPAGPNHAPSSASLTVDYVVPTNGFDGGALNAALRLGGYRSASTTQVGIGADAGTLRTLTGAGSEGLVLLTWAPDNAPGQLAVVTVYEADGITTADIDAAKRVAAQLAAAGETS